MVILWIIYSFALYALFSYKYYYSFVKYALKANHIYLVLLFNFRVSHLNSKKCVYWMFWRDNNLFAVEEFNRTFFSIKLEIRNIHSLTKYNNKSSSLLSLNSTKHQLQVNTTTWSIFYFLSNSRIWFVGTKIRLIRKKLKQRKNFFSFKR